MGRQTRFEVTEQRIRGAFSDLLGTYPVEKITVSMICEKSHTSVGSFYHHFQSKEELIVSTLYATRVAFPDYLRHKLSGNAMDDIRFFLFSNGEMCSQVDISYLKELYTAHIHYGDKIPHVLESPNHELLCKIIEKGQQDKSIRPDQSASQLADLILMTWEGYLYHWCCSNGSYSLTDFVSKHIDCLLALIAA